LTRSKEKELAVRELNERLSRAKSAVLADYRGLNVAQVTLLRRKLREANVELKVVKNTLTRLAAREAGIDGLDPYLEGPTAIAFSDEDVVAPAKMLLQFAKDNKQLEIKAGVVEGRVFGVDAVKRLAELPPKEVLLAQVLAGMQAPLSGMASVLAGPIRKVMYALTAIREKQESITQGV